MPTNTITFKVNDREAHAAFSRIKQEVDQLESEFNTTRSEAKAAGEAIDRLGDRARISAENVERLGNAAKTTTTQLDGLGAAARRNNATRQETDGSLRDARSSFIGAGQGAEFFTRSLSTAHSILTGLGAARAAREMFAFGAASVRSAEQMEGLLRGLRAIEGSQADSRLRDINESAKLQELNTPQIIRYSNSLHAAGATAAEVDAIILTFGQTIVGLGGNAADTSRALLQLTQAFSENKISQENFSTIKALIPNFNKLTQEVYNTDGSMDSLNKRFQDSGQTLGQFLLPILAKLRQEIPTAPIDSYARSVDALQDNITNLIQGTNDAKASIEAYTTARNTATAAGTVNKAFQDRIAFLQQEKTALEAATEGHANYFRVKGRETEASRRYKNITAELETLQVSAGNAASQSEYLRTEQARLATQAQALSTEIDRLNTKLRGRTPRTHPVDFARQREATAELAELQTQIATNANAGRALASVHTIIAQAVETATTNTEHFDLALAKLKATAEDAHRTLQRTLNFQQGTPNFQAAIAASQSEVEGFKAATEAAKEYTDQRQKQINAMPQFQSLPDAQYEGFTSQLRKDFEDAETQGRSLLTVMREIARLSVGPIDLDARIPDPDVRQDEIDQRIAAEVRGAQTLNDIRIEAAEQGRQFLNRLLRGEERDIQKSVNERAKTYRQFANLVSRTFLDLATSRTQNFESVATAFIQQSIRIVLRAFVEFQTQKRLDGTLTASKIVNLQKVAAAQSAAAGAGGLGKLAGLGRFGNLLSGGTGALGVAGLLFPEQIKNLTGGITDTIGNLLDTVASVPDKAFGATQVFLKIGDQEVREITDLQSELRQEARV